jgi:Fe2+ transport system protein FeoA
VESLIPKEMQTLRRAASPLLPQRFKMKMGFMLDPDPERLPVPALAGEQPLSGLPVGAGGRVVSVDVAAVDRERLEVMGLCSGRTVCVIKDGDPMIVRVLGTRIGLAAALATRVLVRSETSPSNPEGEARGGNAACTPR